MPTDTTQTTPRHARARRGGRFAIACLLLASLAGGRVAADSLRAGPDPSANQALPTTVSTSDADEASTNGAASNGGAATSIDGGVTLVTDEEWVHVQDVDDVEIIDAPETPTVEDPAAPGADEVITVPGPIGSPTGPGPADGELAEVPLVGISAQVTTLGNFAKLTVTATGPDELGDLVIDFGDGDTLTATANQLAQLRVRGALVVIHEYEPTLTFQHQDLSVTATDAVGQADDALVGFSTRAYYVLTYSPITVHAFNDCDTFGKGDFELTWNQDGRERKSFFDLGAGDRKTEDRFRNRISGVFYDTDVLFELELRENDPWGAWLLAPWKWDGFKFHGGPGGSSGPRGPVAQFGDHSYEVDSNSTSDAGIPGDDDCAVGMTFTVGLHMVDDVDEAKRLLDGPPAR